jgi:molybdopterin-guanine dinucleotide biosynthesis adapter protein
MTRCERLTWTTVRAGFPDRRMIPVVAFIGHHNVGKTRLLVELIERLSERGLRVGAVKHAPHLDVVEPPNGDSGRLRLAGAHRSMLWARHDVLLRWMAPSTDELVTLLQQLFFDCDLILLEGFKYSPLPKIEVYRRVGPLPLEPLAGEIDVIGVVTDDPVALPDDTERFSLSDLCRLVETLESMAFRPGDA